MSIEHAFSTHFLLADLISSRESNVHQPIEVCQVLLSEGHTLTANCHGAHQFVGKKTTTLKFIVNRQRGGLSKDKEL